MWKVKWCFADFFFHRKMKCSAKENRSGNMHGDCCVKIIEMSYWIYHKSMANTMCSIQMGNDLADLPACTRTVASRIVYSLHFTRSIKSSASFSWPMFAFAVVVVVVIVVFTIIIFSQWSSSSTYARQQTLFLLWPIIFFFTHDTIMT